MKKLITMMLLVTACGSADLSKSVKAIDGAPGKDGRDAVGCDIEKRSDGNYLVCASGEFKIEQSNDWTITQNSDGSVTISRPGKPDITIGEVDIGDNVGQSGPRGPAGKDGTSCRIEKDSNGCIWSVCGDKRELLWIPK